MEFVLGLITGGFGVWIFILMILLGILTEHNNSQKSTVFFGLLGVVVAKYLFGIAWATIGMALVAYIPIGLFWSFWRYRRHCERIVQKHNNGEAYYRDIDYAKREMRPGMMVDKIVSWIIAWPFSMFESFAGDFINAIQVLVRSMFRGMYERTYEKFVNMLVK